MWGNDLTGKIKNDKSYYFYKDHLGSVRAVVDNTGTITAGYDYDAWGYPLENRNYNGDSIKHKYTGKELDKESFYDYFGARYYDARIGRWGQVEPLLDKYPSLTPYNYSLNNTLILVDKNGDDPYRDQLGSLNDVVNILNQNLGKSYWEIRSAFTESNARYVYTQVGGFFDMQHFFAAGFASSIVGFSNTLAIGENIENLQEKGAWTFDKNSGWDSEDPTSNFWGAIFGLSSDNPFSLSQEDIQNFIKQMTELGILDKNDPSIASDKLYIPQNSKDVALPSRNNFIYSPYRGESVDYPIPLRYLMMFGQEGKLP